MDGVRGFIVEFSITSTADLERLESFLKEKIRIIVSSYRVLLCGFRIDACSILGGNLWSWSYQMSDFINNNNHITNSHLNLQCK